MRNVTRAITVAKLPAVLMTCLLPKASRAFAVDTFRKICIIVQKYELLHTEDMCTLI